MDFELHQYGKFSLDDLNNMIPYEKEIYLSLLIEKIRKENEAIQAARRRHGRE